MNKTAQAIKDSEYRFRQIAETINDVFYLYNIVDKRYEFISPNCKDILGVEVEFLLSGKSYTQMYVHEDDKNKMIEANALINSGIPYEKEFRVLIDNKERWLKEKSFPIKDSEGTAIKNSGIITDITEKKLAYESQARQLAFQRIVAETSSQFLNSSTAGLDKTVNFTLQVLGEFFKADRSYILRYNESSWTLDNTHEWCAKGISSMKDHIHHVPNSDLPWLFEKMMTMKPLHIPNIDQLPARAKAEKLEFQHQKIKSLLGIPLHDKNNRLAGIIGMDMVMKAYSWSDSEINMLQIVADVVSSAIIRIDAEKQLIESEEKKSSILSSMDDLVFVLDKKFVFQEYHYSGSDNLLMDPEFFLGKSFDDIDFPEPAFSNIKNVMQRCLLTKTSCNTIYNLDLPNGKKWFDLKATILKDSEGEVKGLTIVTRDITDRKLAEELLIQNSKEVKDINVAVNENSLVSITDTKGVILKANEKFCKLSKYKEEELIGKTHAVINSGYHSKDFWKDVWSTIGKGKIWKGEVQNRAKDGSYYWVQSIINPIFDNEGKIIRYLSIRQDITEQKKIELNLRDSQNKLLMAHQIAKLGHWSLDLVKDELTWSDSIFDIFNIDKNKFKPSYENFLNAIHPEDRDMVSDAYSYSLISKMPYEVTHRLLLKYDQIKWVKESCHTDFDIDGKPLRSIGIVQDITASKTDEIELQHTKDLLDRTNKVARIGGWEINLINNSIYWTEITKEIHGVGPDYEPDMETAINFFKEGASRKLITAAVKKAIKKGEGYDLELQIITSHNKELWVKTLGQVEIKDGKPVRLYGTFQDINEAKKAELQIIRQNEFRKLIAEISSAFIKINGENLIDNEINKVLKKSGLHFQADRCFLYQVSSQDNNIYNTHDWNSTGSKNRPAKKISNNKFPLLAKVIKEKSVLIVNDIAHFSMVASEEYKEWKKQKIKSLLLVCFNISGKPAGLLGLSTSDRHVVWSEEQISGLGVVANIISDALSKYALEKGLIEAKEKAENANRLKTIFLGNLSHEVRTPLQGIMGVTELMETPNLSIEKTNAFIQLIKRRAIDMQNIIESLLDMASLETGEIQPSPIVINLHEIIEEIFVKTQQDNLDLAESIKYNLENKTDEHALVFVDPQHLYQVLTNFVKNSFKFTNEGSIQIICSRKAKAYNIDVIDTGIGISPDKIDFIFVPFRQAHEGLSRSKGGIGLGLSICKKMVEMWGGEVAVKSEPNVGSTFTFTIPSKY